MDNSQGIFAVESGAPEAFLYLEPGEKCSFWLRGALKGCNRALEPQLFCLRALEPRTSLPGALGPTPFTPRLKVATEGRYVRNVTEKPHQGSVNKVLYCSNFMR